MAEYIEREKAMALAKDIIVPSKYGNDYRHRCIDPQEIAELPAADVRPVVLCKDCVYWQKPQVKLNNGTYRDYEPGEYENGSPFGGVTSDVGINIGSFCAMYNTEHQNRIPQFMGENDFCSKGYKRGES